MPHTARCGATGRGCPGRSSRHGTRGGGIELLVDGNEAGRAELPLFMRIMSSVGASIGYDHGSPVSSRYRSEYPFTGTLHQVEIQLVSPPSPDTTDAEARIALAHQ